MRDRLARLSEHSVVLLNNGSGHIVHFSKNAWDSAFAALIAALAAVFAVIARATADPSTHLSHRFFARPPRLAWIVPTRIAIAPCHPCHPNVLPGQAVIGCWPDLWPPQAPSSLPVSPPRNPPPRPPTAARPVVTLQVRRRANRRCTDRRFNRMRPSIAPRKRHQAG